MNSTDGYFDVTADRTKIVTVPDGYEIRFHKIGSSEDIFPDGLSTKDIKDINNTLVVDLSTPGTVDLKGTLLSNGQPLPTMDGVDTEIDKKITALDLPGTYASKANVYTKTEVFSKSESSSTFATISALNQVKTTADAAAPQSTTYSKTECDGKFAQPAWVNTVIDNKIAQQNIPTTYATIVDLNVVKATAAAAAPQATTYTKTECNTKFLDLAAVDTEIDSKIADLNIPNTYATTAQAAEIKVTAEAAAPKSTVLTFDSNKVLTCPTDMKVTDISSVTVVNGSFLFKDTGEVYLGVNGAWVQLGVPTA